MTKSYGIYDMLFFTRECTP